MKRSLVVGCLALLLAPSVNAQGLVKAEEEFQKIQKSEVADKVYYVAEEPPTFPGGQAALVAFLGSHVKYHVEARKRRVEGRVLVTFVVEKDGSLSGLEVMRSLDPYLDREAIRAVAAMPKWNAGKQDGNPVRVRCTIPVVFRLQ